MESNVKKMREALDALNCIDTRGLKRLLFQLVESDIFDGGQINKTISAVEKARRALSAPPRNCDRFSDETEAMVAFLNEVWLISVNNLKQDPFDEWTPEMKARYAKWLMEFRKEEKEGDMV